MYNELTHDCQVITHTVEQAKELGYVQGLTLANMIPPKSGENSRIWREYLGGFGPIGTATKHKLMEILADENRAELWKAYELGVEEGVEFTASLKDYFVKF